MTIVASSTFICPRCNYECKRKSHIEYHFNRKKSCKNLNNVDLTDEIKEVVIRDRVYHPPKQKSDPQIINNYNNQYNAVMNILNTSLTPMQMIEAYMQYNNINVLSLEDYLDEKYCEQTEKFKNPKFLLELKMDDFMEVVDEISSSSKNQEEMNIVYDSKTEKINIKDDDEWKSSLVNKGMQKIVEKLQESYLDYYETFLINKIETNTVNLQQQQRDKELIDEYYKFLLTFDLPTYCLDKKDYHIIDSLKHGTSSTKIVEKYCERYFKVKSSIKHSNLRSIKKTVLDIIKRNTEVNMKVIKSRISDLFCNDATFKDFFERVIKNSRTLENEALE